MAVSAMFLFEKNMGETPACYWKNHAVCFSSISTMLSTVSNFA
jgi:hypothetical protein